MLFAYAEHRVPEGRPGSFVVQGSIDFGRINRCALNEQYQGELMTVAQSMREGDQREPGPTGVPLVGLDHSQCRHQ